MNPEFLRNLWLEASPFRLGLIAGLLLLAFVAASMAPQGLATVDGTARALYWFFVVLWGTRSAALSVVGEIRERTWDGQKLSSIEPSAMMWGKLFGATFANWFGGFLCLPFLLAPVWIAQGPRACITYALVHLTLGVFAQAVALLSSLALVRRNTGNWRMDTFLCQVAGIGAAFTYYTLWSSLDAFERSGQDVLVWWGHVVNLQAFHLVSLLVFVGWALVGCWRAMRAELRFSNGPFVWLAYLVYICVYQAGFAPWLSARAHLDLAGTSAGLHDATLRMAMAVLALLGATYSMVFLEPKDPVRMRWLGERLRAGQWRKAFMALDAWMLSYGAALLGGLVLAFLLSRDNATLNEYRMSAQALPVLAMLGFLTRDVAIFVALRGVVRGKGDFATLAVLGALYILLPLILHGLKLGAFDFLFLPVPNNSALLGVGAAWTQGIVAMAWAMRSIGTRLNAP